MKKIIYSSILLMSALVFVFGLIYTQSKKADATVVVGNECNATTTDSTWTLPRSITTGVSTLCNVNITATGATSILAIYDATTTNISLRNNVATSSITIARWPSGTAMGAFPFEVQAKLGLIVEVSSGGTGNATATVTYRNY